MSSNSEMLHQHQHYILKKSYCLTRNKKEKLLKTMIFQKNILSLQAQNQTGSFVMCARLSLYF